MIDRYERCQAARDAHTERCVGTGTTTAVNYDNSVCIVTGAGSGIGRQLALTLGARGARVAVSDIDAQAAAATAESVNAAGPGQAEAAPLDVTDGDAVGAYVRDVAARHGRLDLIVNNAGIAVSADARDYALSHWREVVDVNLMGVIHGVDAAYRVMAAQGSGHIVNISSLSGLIPFPTNLPYGATKFAVVGLSLGLRTEAEDLGVRVSVVCPGFVQSNIYTASRVLNVDNEELTRDPPFRIVPTAAAVERILKGVDRNEAVIVFPFYARLFWWLFRLRPALMRSSGLRFIREFRKLRRQD